MGGAEGVEEKEVERVDGSALVNSMCTENCCRLLHGVEEQKLKPPPLVCLPNSPLLLFLLLLLTLLLLLVLFLSLSWLLLCMRSTG